MATTPIIGSSGAGDLPPWPFLRALQRGAPPEEDALSAEEKAELEQLRDLKTYTDALTATILPSALGTMEAAAKGSRSKLAAVVREQCAAVREQAGITE